MALRQWSAARLSLTEATRAQTAAAQAASHANARVDAGLEPPPVALDAAAAQQRAQRAALLAQAEALLAFGQTQLALGAWQPHSPAMATR